MAQQDKAETIDTRIVAAYDELTDSERRLAEVVLEAAADLPGLTASALARKAEVSNATAARFFKRLGYESYAEARKAAFGARHWGSPLHELAGIGARRQDAGDFGLHIAEDLKNLTRTAELLSPELLAAAVGILVEAKRISIVGFRNSAVLALYARGLLAHLKPGVHLLPMAGQTLAEDLVGLGKDDAVLVFGFRRRPPVLREVIAHAHDAGAPTVLIADPSVAGLAQLASVTLRCHSAGHGMFDSYAAPMSLINYLCSATALALGPAAEERLAEIETLHQRLDPIASTVKGKGPSRRR